MSNPYGNHLPFDDMTKKTEISDYYKSSSFTLPPWVKDAPTERTFMTNPVQTYTNNQTEFAKYLYPNTRIGRDTGYLYYSQPSQQQLITRKEYHPIK